MDGRPLPIICWLSSGFAVSRSYRSRAAANDMDRQQDVIRRITAHVVAYRFQLENERRNMSRLTEKLAAAAAGAPRQSAKIEARADRIIARESDIERRTDDVFVPHEQILYEAEMGLDGLDAALRLMSNSPPLEHSTPLPGGPRVLPDGPAGVGDLNLPVTTTTALRWGR